jgi:hypothetical protein
MTIFWTPCITECLVLENKADLCEIKERSDGRRGDTYTYASRRDD